MSDSDATPESSPAPTSPSSRAAVPPASASASAAGRGRILIGSQRDPALPIRTPAKPKSRTAEGEATENAATEIATTTESASGSLPETTDAGAIVAPTPVRVVEAARMLEEARAVEDPSTTIAPHTPDGLAGAKANSPDPHAVEPTASAEKSAVTHDPPDTGTPTVSEPTAALPQEMSLDEEIEAALGGLSLEQILAADSATATDELEPGARVKATVRAMHGDNVFVSVQGRYEGLTSLRQFSTPPQPGAVLEVVIKRFNANDGLYEVSVPGSSINVADWADLAPGAIVEARVTGSNTGGLEVQVHSIRGFIPASQIDLYRVEQFGDYVNQRMQCVVTEANEDRQKLVLSRRAILEREKEVKRQALLESIAVGEMRDGVVTKLMDFGAFVEIGGTEGLVHISKLSWDRVTHPSEVLKVGEKIKVKVEKVDTASGKISLSYRDTLQDPWEQVEQKYPVNSVVQGTVSRIAQFGAFVKLEPGVEGLVHISELAHHRVFAVRNVVQEGAQVEVKVLAIDRPAQKMSLSLKATQARPEPKQAATEEETPDEPPRPLAVKKSNAPLKGGRDRRSGGESIGLQW